MPEIVRLLVNGEEREVTVLARERNSVRFALSGREYLVEFPAGVPESSGGNRKPLATRGSSQSGGIQSGEFLQVIAPIPGVICEVIARAGTDVEAGELLLRLEAMKMQNGIFSPVKGKIAKICVEEGREVLDGEVLLEIRPA